MKQFGMNDLSQEKLVKSFENNILKYAKNPQIYNQKAKIRQLKKEYDRLVKEKALDTRPLSQETQTLMDKIFNEKSIDKGKTR